jgi:hypothetical protein
VLLLEYFGEIKVLQLTAKRYSRKIFALMPLMDAENWLQGASI